LRLSGGNGRQFGVRALSTWFRVWQHSMMQIERQNNALNFVGDGKIVLVFGGVLGIGRN
jgi:hypothetical protein